ncbi:MAG: diadenylate cyclase [Thermoleophilia bacterium]|nr:diadenylate cyclase [Thermoleophilia bacterium]
MMERLFGPVCDRVQCTAQKRQVLEELIELAVELAREGREGRKVGTLFVFGDHESVLERSRPLLLDPLQGHDRELLHVSRADLRETIKELAQLDGGFVVDSEGYFRSAARYVNVELESHSFGLGLGTRHAAGSSITAQTGAVAIVVSQSSVVRIYAGGELIAEIIPELYLMNRERLFTRNAKISDVPEFGLAIAVSEGDDDRVAG